MPFKTILICYANQPFYFGRQKLLASAAKFKDFDECHGFSPGDVDSDFREKHSKIFNNKRGDGYWLWKPYFIKRMLDNMAAGDIVVYLDSGCYFINSCKPLIDLCKQETTPVICFKLRRTREYKWTKKDCVIALDCDRDEYLESPQIEASFHLWRKCEQSDKLVMEWLHYAQDYQLVSDAPSKRPNHPDFREHRHDQSIFSLLCKKHDIIPYRLPSQFGNRDIITEYKYSRYPQIIHHHRIRRKRILTPSRKDQLKAFLGKCFFYFIKCINIFKRL